MSEKNKIIWLVDDISETEKEEIEKCLEKIHRGEAVMIESEQAMKEIREKLKKYRKEKGKK